ncbi:MAG TPA: glycosyltransferase [bacterium]|nr:glycosyltransferase [bacterium]
MRAGIFTNNFYPRLSGVAVAVNFLDTALKMQGHETLVVAPDYGYGRKVKGVEVFRVKSVYLRPMHVSLPLARFDEAALKEVMDDWKPEIIHSHHPFWLGKAALDTADEAGVPLVYTFHTLYEFFTHYFMLDTDSVRKAVREFVIRYTDRCDLVIAPTEPIKDYLKSIGVKTRVEAVPTGIDFSRFKKVTPDQVEGLAKVYKLDRFDGVLLAVGRISKEKNAALALHALAELKRRGKNYALLIFGDGPEIGSLQDEAKDLKIAESVIWGGFLDQDTLAVAYFLGDVFLFPSGSDTQGIVLYEARAAGLPVVATDSMASRAAVKEGENGLFAADDPKDFADKIEQILSDRKNFRAPFDTEAFSHQSLGQTYDRLYNEAIKKGRKKPDPQAATSLSRLLDEIKSMVQ